MSEVEDWLQDPLRKVEGGSYKSRKLKSANDRQNGLWHSFHFATRLKLDGADHFCRQVLGAASRPYDLGLPLLAHRQLKWYLEAFFFELMSAYDTLRQELNIVYAYNLELKPEEVKWKKIKSRLPNELVEYMEKEWEEEWFKKIRQYRNTAAHHSYVWTGNVQGGSGDKPWHYDMSEVSIYYLDDYGTLKGNRISVCNDSLRGMVEHIHQVWEVMAEEFE